MRSRRWMCFGTTTLLLVAAFVYQQYDVKPLNKHSKLGFRSFLYVQDPAEYTSFRLDTTPPSQSPNQRTHLTVMRAFEQTQGDVWNSTVQVMSGNRQLALGMVVDEGGWILTKSSELQSQDLSCRFFDGGRSPALIVATDDSVDLALLKVERADVRKVRWHPENLVPLGGWLASSSNTKLPIAIGVVSVGPRVIKSEKAKLGVGLEPYRNGSMITMVLAGGGAARAGIEVGDIILSIDGQRMESQDAVLRKIGESRAGQFLTFGLSRNEVQMTITAQLMDLSPNLLDPTEMEVNGAISARSNGFNRVFQHDTVLAPHQCGGPLVDLRGRVVGVNIARAGRVNSYALPMDVVIPAANKMLTDAKQKSETLAGVK